MQQNTVKSLILTTPELLTQHPAKLYLESLALSSEPTMKRSLNLVAQLLTNGQADYLTLDWSALRYEHTAAIRAALVLKNYQPPTINCVLSALRRVLDEALRLKLISPSDYAHAVDIRSVKLSNELRGRVLSQDEIDALMQTIKCDLTPTGFRDAALFALLRGAGLRRAEVVNLDLKDFNNHGEINVLSGNANDRTVYLPPTAVAMVNGWIEIRGKTPGPLLCQVNKSLRVVHKRLTPQAVLFILHNRSIQAGVEPFSPHDLRHTFASDLLAAGIDVDIVQAILGHSIRATTLRYCERTEEKKRLAVAQLVACWFAD